MTRHDLWKQAVGHYANLLGLREHIYPSVGRCEDVLAGAETHTLGDSAEVVLEDRDRVLVPEIQLIHGSSARVFPTSLDELAAHELLHLLGKGEEEVREEVYKLMGRTDEGKALVFLQQENHEKFLSAVASVLAKLSPSGE